MNIGIIGAMNEEIVPLLEHYINYEKILIANQTYYKISTSSGFIYIVQSKIGKVAAAMTATLLIEKFSCENIFFTGVAGGLCDSLEVGDLVIADKLCHHDVDITAFGHPKGHNPEIGVFVETCPELRTLAKAVAKTSNIPIKEGTIATGDQFISCQKVKNQIIGDFNALAIEMEGVAVAQVCKEMNIPCLILRSISDKANGEAPSNFDSFVDQAAKNSSKYLLCILDSILA